jgi:hypothetical protein
MPFSNREVTLSRVIQSKRRAVDYELDAAQICPHSGRKVG